MVRRNANPINADKSGCDRPKCQTHTTAQKSAPSETKNKLASCHTKEDVRYQIRNHVQSERFTHLAKSNGVGKSERARPSSISQTSVKKGALPQTKKMHGSYRAERSDRKLSCIQLENTFKNLRCYFEERTAHNHPKDHLSSCAHKLHTTNAQLRVYASVSW